MIYVDPPYGIKYSSNFQPRTDRRDVKDRDEDLTHEPEQIKAYRDTWKLGIHSYIFRTLGKDWKEWEIPRQAEAERTEEAQRVHEHFWTLKRQKRQEIDESIQRNARK